MLHVKVQAKYPYLIFVHFWSRVGGQKSFIGKTSSIEHPPQKTKVRPIFNPVNNSFEKEPLLVWICSAEGKRLNAVLFIEKFLININEILGYPNKV